MYWECRRETKTNSRFTSSKCRFDQWKQFIKRPKRCHLNLSLDACLSNAGKGSANIDKLIGEINASNSYIKRLISTNSKNDSLNLALSNKLKRSLDNVADADVDVKVLKGVVMISLSDKMLYKTGDYNILPAAQEVLGKVAKVINDYDTYSVLIEGNTDNVPLASANLPKDNWDLSALRATSVAKILQTQFGVNPNRITAGGRSEYNPKTTNASVSGRAENRRTEIIIMPKLDEFMKLMDIAPVKNKFVFSQWTQTFKDSKSLKVFIFKNH